MTSATPLLPAVAAIAPTASSEAGAAVASSAKREKTAKDFEAMFLRQTLEDILPSQDSGAFGTGSAGGIWRSMMADQLSSILAERNILGLSQSVLTSGVAGGKGEQK